MIRQPRNRKPRFAVAIGAYLVGSIVIEYVLLLANSQLHLHLEQQQTLLPSGFPLVGNLSWFSLIYLATLVALIWLLYRTGVMPRELFGRPPARRPAEWDTYTMGPHEPQDAARTQDDERIL